MYLTQYMYMIVQRNNQYIQCVIIYRKELDLCDFWLSRFNILSSGPNGSVCVSCCLVSDVKCMWLPMRISQVLVCKQRSHQNFEIALEFNENEWSNNVVGSYMHALASLAFFTRPDKMNLQTFYNVGTQFQLLGMW